MTREEVKQEFITKQPSINECEFCPNKGIRLWKCAEVHGCKWAQAMMEIAKMLESEPCEDCISRQAAEAIFRNAKKSLYEQSRKGKIEYKEFQTREMMLLNAEQFIHLLPSVEPERKTGKWLHADLDIPGVGYYKCSVCGDDIYDVTNYCPNCGAKMEVSNDT